MEGTAFCLMAVLLICFPASSHSQLLDGSPPLGASPGADRTTLVMRLQHILSLKFHTALHALKE